MKIKDFMSKSVVLGKPDMTVAQAAQLMAEGNFGILPIEDGDRLIGVITDRDITTRCVALSYDPSTLVGQVMTQEVLYCYDDQNVEEAIENIGRNKIWRLPVVNKNKKLVGIVSLCDLSCASDTNEKIDETLQKLSFRDNIDFKKKISQYQFPHNYSDAII